MGASPTQRTLEYLRDTGWPVVEVVEHYNPHSRKHSDLFGFGDVAALHPDKGLLIVQVTTSTHVNARLRKLRDEAYDAVLIAIQAPGVTVEVHGWRKIYVCTKCGKPKRGVDKCVCGHKVKRIKWMPRIIAVTEENLNES